MKGRSSIKKVTSNSEMWQSAAEQAKATIEGLKSNIRKLRFAIRTFEENAADGEPWPGGQIIRQDKELLGKQGLLGKAVLTCKNYRLLCDSSCTTFNNCPNLGNV
jgi:hypothetical protein